MNSGNHPIKTAAGQAELATRSRGLSQRHRTVLFLVDGRHSEAQVRAMAEKAGVSQLCVDELLEMGMIELPKPSPVPAELPDPPPVVMTTVSSGGELSSSVINGMTAQLDSVLPASRTLIPDTPSELAALDGVRGDEVWAASPAGANPGAAVEEAREFLIRVVKADAPVVSGSLTLLRLRRARTRSDLLALLEEVQARIAKPNRSLVAAQTVRRVRDFLEGRLSSLAP